MPHRRVAPPPGHVPDDIVVELIDMLYTVLVPTLVMALVVGAVGVLAFSQVHDIALLGLTGATTSVGAGRIALILAYRHARATRPWGIGTARVWERRYALGAALFSALLGAFNMRALMDPHAAIHMLVTSIIFGYGAGVVTRVSVRPAICVMTLMLAVLPTAFGMALAAGAKSGARFDITYAGQAIIVLLFAVTSLETVRHLYRRMLLQLVTRHDLASLARTDVLTGLANRLQLRERFNATITDVRDGEGMLAVHMMDLDRFKAVNDRLGHPAGDEVLREAARRLARLMGPNDIAARQGGDEFVILQGGLSNAGEAELLARRMVRAIAAPYDVAGEQVEIGTSIGIAVAPGDGSAFEQLIAAADAALYRAKLGTRGVAFADPGGTIAAA